MYKDKLVMVPGPTMVPEGALLAGSRQVMHHRSPEYGKLFAEVNANLQYVFQTKAPVLTFPAAGTGGLEAAIVNLFSPGDKVLSASVGVFGDRFAAIAACYGLEVVKIPTVWGTAVDPAVIRDYLQKEPQFKAVLVTHNETSTGVVNDLAAIGRVLKQFNVLYIVDAVSSLGGMDLQTDAWGIDVVITASQKALMSPPGLTFISVSERAWQAVAQAKLPRYYWDFAATRKALEKNPPQNPYTPAVTLLAALNEALRMIKAEGLANTFARHRRLANGFRQGVEALGLTLYAAAGSRSDTVTAVTLPEGIKGEQLVKIMSEKYNVAVAGGQESLKGKMIRVGHMGYINEYDIITAITALEYGLNDLGYTVKLGQGVQAAQLAMQD